MDSRNYEIRRNFSAPIDEEQSNLQLNKEAPVFMPQSAIEESKAPNPSALSFEWSSDKIAGISSFTPRSSMSAKAHTFVPAAKSTLSIEASEFRLSMVEDEESLIEKGPSFINKVIDEIDTKNSSLSDIEIPCEYIYTVDEMRSAFAEFECSESPTELTEGLTRMSARSIESRARHIKHHDKKPKEGWKQREKRDSRIENEKWRNEIIQEEMRLIEKARLYKERLRKPIQEREKIKRTIKITLNKLSPNNLDKLKLQ